MSTTTRERPDIDAATAHMHRRVSGRVLRGWLAPHLLEDEVVQDIAVGAYHGDRGVMARTDGRVLFVQGPAGDGLVDSFDIGQITAAEWVRHGATGTITVRAGGHCAMLTRVTLDDGRRAVTDLR